MVTTRVTNRLRETTALHWHGLIVPADMDGVPGVSFAGIAPGATFTYRFKANQSGTYWYHAHARFQEQVGLYGSIVIDPRNGERHAAQREHVILFSDWTDRDPEDIYRTLKLQSDYFNLGKRTFGDFMRDARSQGLSAALAERRMWGAMRMQPTDLADVSAYAYTYLTNGTTPAGNWTGTFEQGERVRLRVINGSSMSTFDLRIPDLKLTVIAADGQDIEPRDCRRAAHRCRRGIRRAGRAERRSRVHDLRAVDRSLGLCARHARTARRHGGADPAARAAADSRDE
jgi:CopA family copper-resistance protein